MAGQGMGTLMPLASTPSYDSNLNASRDDKKNKFASTMEFVEDYLNNVVSEAVPFANEEKNKLTFEVGCGCLGLGGGGAGVHPSLGLGLHPGMGCRIHDPVFLVPSAHQGIA